MSYISRNLEKPIKHTLERDKSILLFGARQTGKTTLIREQLRPDISYSLANIETRLRFEKDPRLFARELETELTIAKPTKKPLIAIDEVQKIPIILDVVQDLIDRNLAQFILTGSSARKLKYGRNINLLPGRIVAFKLNPLMLSEISASLPPIEQLLLFGSLPGIFSESSSDDKNIDLETYVKVYLEEEIRAEALVRNVGDFARFLELAANESGNLINFSKLSQEIGISSKSLRSYYQILEDCLLVEKVEPLTKSIKSRKLSKAIKYLFFDLGIRRICANEGPKLSEKMLGNLFEQFIGLELFRCNSLLINKFKVLYWRDHAGPEVDYVLDMHDSYIPIEVKWTATPTLSECKHLNIFLNEYSNVSRAFIVCRAPKKVFLTPKILALPWQELPEIFCKV